MHGAPEVAIFAGGGIQVTSARLICWQHTYPMAGITAVAPFTLPADRMGPWLGAVWSALWFFVWTTAAILGGGAGGEAIYIVAAMLLALGSLALAVVAARWARSKKDVHGIMITTGGVPVRPIVSQDPAFVGAVVAALNQALQMR